MYNKREAILMYIKPLEHVRELALGSVSNDVPLVQILQSVNRLEKLQLSSDIQNEIIFDTNTQLQIMPENHIDAYMIHSVRSLHNLKDLQLKGLTSDAYSAAADVLPTMIQMEVLVISNSNITVPACIVRSIQSLQHIKCLTLHGREIENLHELVTEFSTMAQTKTLRGQPLK